MVPVSSRSSPGYRTGGRSLIRHWTLIGIVPIYWLILAAVMQLAMGRYTPFDPDYYYLLSSVDLVSHTSVGMYHHPGTTAEVFGAVIIRAAQPFLAPGVDAQTAVLKDPEAYLAVIHGASAVMVALGFFAFGLSVLRATGTAWLAALLQCSVLMTPVVVNDAMARFKAEPFLVLASLLAMSLLVLFVRARSAGQTRFALLFAVVCGFGLATKFTFVSVAFIPLILLSGMRNRALFVAGTAVAAIVFTLPMADRYDDLWRWTYLVVSHTGIYGDGAPGVVDLDAYRQGFGALVSRNSLFGTIVGLAAFVLTWAALHAWWRRSALPGRDVRALGAITLSQIAGFGLVAKYGTNADSSRYLLGLYCLLGLTAWLSICVILKAELAAPTILKRAVIAVLIVAGVASLAAKPREINLSYSLLRSARDSHALRDEGMARLDSGEFEGFARVYDMGYRSNVLGLLQASVYSTQQLEALARIYRGVYFCEPGCTPDTWASKPLIGMDTAKQFTAQEVSDAFQGHIVLLHGRTPSIQVIGLPPATP